MIVGVPFVLEGQSAITDMVQVLEPLEVGDGDTARIQEQVWYHQDLLLA